MFGIRNERNEVLTVPLDGVRESELLARMVASAVRGQGMLITYLTAWTLVQASRDPAMSRLFRQFDVCYADGMGVVLCSFLLNGRRIHKVTANIFIYRFLEQVARQRLSVMLVGADEEVIETTAEQIKANYPAMELVGYSNGYSAVADEANLQKKLLELKPRIVIVGMGQPLQENWCCRMRETFPDTVFLCVGGLFDYFAGEKPTPPRLIRNLGFEWLYILVLRPRRFWRRYIFGIPMLGWLVMREYGVKVMALAQIGIRAKTQKK
jgi:N-acetylglucosaminyldiphosphoundecaprenol N-acetyl-beta-D-mannosaminyltransferase